MGCRRVPPGEVPIHAGRKCAVKIIDVGSLTRPLPHSRRLLFGVSVIVFLWVAGACAGTTKSVMLAWDPSPDPSVSGYCVHYGTASRAYSALVDAGSSTTAKVTGLLPGLTYFFAVTAYNPQRIESAPSGEIVYTVPSPVLAPIRLVRSVGSKNPSLQFQVKPSYPYSVQASEDLRSWTTLHRSVSLSTSWIEWTDPQATRQPKRFYRLAIPEGPLVPGWLQLVHDAVPAGAVRLRPLVTQGQRYQIQASEDQITWTTLHEAVCHDDPPLDFVDRQAGLHSKRFHRLMLLNAPPFSRSLQIFEGGDPGGSRLQIAAMNGQRYRVEASPDMITWRTIYEGLSHSTEPVDLIDAQAGRFPSRFYRLAFD